MKSFTWTLYVIIIRISAPCYVLGHPILGLVPLNESPKEQNLKLDYETQLCAAPGINFVEAIRPDFAG